MTLLPLSLSAHPSGWNPAGATGEAAGQHPDLEPSCRFCGFDAAGWQEPFHLDGDHANTKSSNIVPACPLCHLCQHMDRPRIQDEAVLVWLPEASQGAVVALARRIHIVLHTQGEQPHMARGRPVRTAEPVASAWAAQLALRGRADLAMERLGTTSPLDFAAALLGLSAPARERGATLLRGLRLLPLGRLHHGGRDAYPDMLSAWAAAAPGSVRAPRPPPSRAARC